jgi:hypothetical protein
MSNYKMFVDPDRQQAQDAGMAPDENPYVQRIVHKEIASGRDDILVDAALEIHAHAPKTGEDGSAYLTVISSATMYERDSQGNATKQVSKTATEQHFEVVSTLDKDGGPVQRLRSKLVTRSTNPEQPHEMLSAKPHAIPLNFSGLNIVKAFLKNPRIDDFDVQS